MHRRTAMIKQCTHPRVQVLSAQLSAIARVPNCDSGAAMDASRVRGTQPDRYSVTGTCQQQQSSTSAAAHNFQLIAVPLLCCCLPAGT
jgi:hypothetical protein